MKRQTRIGNYSLHFRAELIKIVMRAEHEIGNYSFHFHAELIKIVIRAQHEIGNYSLHFRAELKSGFQFNHASIINEVLNLINLRCMMGPLQGP